LAGLLFVSAAPSFDLFLCILVGLATVAVTIGCLIQPFSAQTDYFGHLATVLFIIALLHFGLQSFRITFAIPTITMVGAWLFYRRVIDFW
jgi:hypothetical protein